MLDLIIVGAGGCGREVYEMARESFSPETYRIRGFLSDNRADLDNFLEIKSVAPIIDTIEDYQVQKNDRFLLAIGSPAGRKLVAEKMLAKGAEFVSLIHPTAKVFPSAKLGQGIIIYPFVLVSSSVRLGDFCLLNAYAGCGHDAVVGEYSVLCPYAAVLGFSELHEECFMATHTMLAPHKVLGKGTIVSANSAALRSAPDNSFVLGVPGKNM